MRADPSGAAERLCLLAWLSPAFPVGAFAYSHGIETAVDAGDVADAASLQAWLTDLLEHGSARNDCILVSSAWAAAADVDAIGAVNDLALALCPSRERLLETGAMGTAFATAIKAAWPDAACPRLPPGQLAYPVAFGAACAERGLDRRGSLEAYALAFVQNLVSAAVRLGAIGQTDGQRVTAAMVPHAVALAAVAGAATLDDIGGCAHRSDIAAMRHETLYSRLFRS